MHERKISEVDHQVQAINRKFQIFQLQRKNQGCYFVGPTGSGKSTLVNYLLNKTMQEGKKSGSIRVCDEGGPQISQKFSSCTRGSNIFEDGDGNAYIDNAGLKQTRGMSMDIENSYLFSKMIQKGNKIKLIIMIDFDSIHGTKGAIFFQTFQRLSQMFKEQQISRSCMLVISKVDFSEVTTKDVEQLTLSTIEERKLNLAKKIMKNKNFFIFPKYKFIEKNFVPNLKKKIKELPSHYVTKNVNIVLSPESIVEFRKIISQVNEDFDVAASLFEKEISFKGEEENKKQPIKKNLTKLKLAKQIIVESLEANPSIQIMNQGLQLVSHELKLSPPLMHKIENNFKKIEICQKIDKKAKFDEKGKIKEVFVGTIDKTINKLEKKLTHLEDLKEMNEKINENEAKNSQYFYRELQKLSELSKNNDMQAQFQNDMRKELNNHFEKYFENLRIQTTQLEQKIRNSDFRQYKVVLEDRGCVLM